MLYYFDSRDTASCSLPTGKGQSRRYSRRFLGALCHSERKEQWRTLVNFATLGLLAISGYLPTLALLAPAMGGILDALQNTNF